MYVDYSDRLPISAIVGMTFTGITENDDKTELLFTRYDGKRYLMYHDQDCCEWVSIEDICGDMVDLLNTPILSASEETNNNTSSEPDDSSDEPDDFSDSHTWTFYKIATIKGFVTIRWYGTSNGYYSEDVQFGPVYEATNKNEEV